MATGHISKDCKLFKDCPNNYDCLYEIAMCGSAVWSLELCYDLAALEEQGLISQNYNVTERKLYYGLRGTFFGPEYTLQTVANEETKEEY